MNNQNDSLFIHILKPVILLFIVGTALSSIILIKFNQKIAIEWSVEFAKKNADQYVTLRKYYTENVAQVVNKHSNIQISHEINRPEKTIPLPSTLMHEISEELFKEKGNIQMKVYSDYPFPSRASREQDSFAKEALSAISANKGIYFRQDKINNIDVMRVAIPDYFSSPACIACHNSLQSSPKKNWKLNDISGVIEINVPIEKQLSIMRTETLNVLFILSIIFIFIGYMIFYRLKQKVITPIKVIESSLVSIDEGKPLCSVNLKEVTEFSNLSNRINNVSKNLFDKIAAAKSESSLRKIAQDELRHVNANLEDQVRIRTIEVQEKNEQLHEKIAVIEATRERLIETEKMASLGSMVAGVAHEINTPIGTALTAQTFLLDKSEAIQHKMKNNNLAKKEFDDFLLEMDASLSLINSNLSRAADLISSFKQISADQSVELRGKFKVEELLSNCKTTASPNLHEGQHTIVIECDSDIVISSYPGALTQIIINLIPIHSYMVLKTNKKV